MDTTYLYKKDACRLVRSKYLVLSPCMSVSFSTHLTVLKRSAELFGDSPAFQLPNLDPSSGQVLGWTPVSYRRFQLDVDNFARHLLRVLQADHLAPQSVIGLWYVGDYHALRAPLTMSSRLSGLTYTDVLHVYGLSRAGYIPQLFSIRLENPTVVNELLRKAGAHALIYEKSFKVAGCSVPNHEALDYDAVSPSDDDLPLLHAGVHSSDPAFIFHTSGSTSGSPKLVRCSFRWLESAIKKCEHVMKPIKASEKRDVTVWM